MLIDISSNNPHPIDFAKVKADGVTAVFIKATEGTDYTNPFFEEDLKAAERAGLPVLAYHYVGTVNGVFMAGNPEEEAKHFLSIARAKARVLDIETSANVEWARRFIAALGLTPHEGLLYGSYRVVPNQGFALAWVADYGTKPQVQMECWQYTDRASVNGIEGGVDGSTWLGTADQFNVLFGLTPTPPVPTPPVPPQAPFKPIRPWAIDKRVQSLRAKLGPKGTNVYGPVLQRRIKGFKTGHGLGMGAIVDEPTWKALGL